MGNRSGRMGLWAGVVALAVLALVWVTMERPSGSSSAQPVREQAAGIEASAPGAPSTGISANGAPATSEHAARSLTGKPVDGGTTQPPTTSPEERRAEHQARHEQRTQRRQTWREQRQTRIEQKQARILESVAGDPEARAAWEARFEERRRKQEAAEWRHSEEGREARRERAREHAARAAARAQEAALPTAPNAVVGGSPPGNQ